MYNISSSKIFSSRATIQYSNRHSSHRDPIPIISNIFLLIWLSLFVVVIESNKEFIPRSDRSTGPQISDLQNDNTIESSLNKAEHQQHQQMYSPRTKRRRLINRLAATSEFYLDSSSDLSTSTTTTTTSTSTTSRPNRSLLLDGGGDNKQQQQHPQVAIQSIPAASANFEAAFQGE